MTDLIIRSSALASIVLSALCTGAPASAQEVAKEDLVINGPFYKQLVQMKDVVADILPPPAYIIEAYLTVLQIVDALDSSLADGSFAEAEQATIAQFVDYGHALRDGLPGVFPGYFERIAVWTSDLSEATPEDVAIKEAMIVGSAEPAAAFFELLDSEFYGLALAGDLEGAKALARDALKTSYDAHRSAVDVVVSLSRGINSRIEQEVADKLLAAAGDPAVLEEVLIGSPLYLKVIQMKDLVADILPPPAYIIESYLTVLELIDATESALVDGVIDAAEQARIDFLIEWGRQLKEGQSALGELAGYFERQAFWLVDLPEATAEEQSIKTLMLEASAEPAKLFYELQGSVFVPLIESGDVAGAKAITREQLLPLYTEHRASIDQLVLEANARFVRIDAEVRARLAAAPLTEP